MMTADKQHDFDSIKLRNADCKEVLKLTKDRSVALIIVDPPYGGHTHNQNDWDVAWSDEEWIEIVREVYRVLVPGGHMIVFSSGKSTLDINMSIVAGYKTLFKKKPSYYPMVWVHHSQDSGRVHQHLPRSQFESMHVYYREGEGKLMEKAGTFAKSYAFDQHVGRHNVFHIDKDDCHKKPYPTVQNFFAENKAASKNMSTFDYKPEALIRALIRDYSKPGHLVMDLCMRHGMTAVACKIEMRRCVGIEIDKKAYQLAVSRFNDQFGTVQQSFPLDSDSETASTVDDFETPVRYCATAVEVADKPVSDKPVDELAVDKSASASMHYSRPRGRPPSNCEWSFETGEWKSVSACKESNTSARSKDSSSRIKRCGTPGCLLEDNHLGLCSCSIVGKRKRACIA